MHGKKEKTFSQKERKKLNERKQEERQNKKEITHRLC